MQGRGSVQGVPGLLAVRALLAQESAARLVRSAARPDAGAGRGAAAEAAAYGAAPMTSVPPLATLTL